MSSFESYSLCRTSQGTRNQFQRLQSKPQTAATMYKKRSQMPRANTPHLRSSHLKDPKKALFQVCSQIGRVFPKERFTHKTQELDIEGIKSQGIRITILQLQYLLVKKDYYQDDIKQVVIKLAQKVSRELAKGSEIFNTADFLKTENAVLKSSIIANKSSQQKLNIKQKRQLMKSAVRHDVRVSLQNNKLGCINKQLLRMIQKMQDSQQAGPISTLEQAGGLSDWMLQDFKNKISYLQLKLASEQNSKGEFLDRVSTQERIAKDACDQSAKLREENSKLKESKLQWMQRALMQLQDRVNKSTNSDPRKLVYTSLKKNQSKTYIVPQSPQPQVKVPQERKMIFEYQLDFFKSIRTYYYENKTACYKMNVCWRADQLGLNYEKPESQTAQAHPLAQLTPLPQLSYYRPSFYSFIEHLHKRDDNNCELSRSLIQKMRCIMQSKTNQFLIYEDVDKYTRFPQFVYSWFKKYYFDSDRNCIVESLCQQESGFQSSKFYRELMNVKLDQTWEVVTFREFLLEEAGLECLYFYLQCQNMLFRRSGITEEIQYLGEFVLLVKYSVAKTVLEVILSEFDSWNVEFLINKMNQKLVIVKDQQFIESSFFLRCLLEYYKIERMNRYKYIRKVACQLKDNEKYPSLNHLECMKVLSKFPDITYSDRLRIYRDCYSVGRGLITPEVIFTVCTESRVFLQHLKIKSFYKLPLQTSKNYESGSLFCLQPPHPYIYRIFSKIKTLLTEGSPFSRKVISLGVEGISHRIAYFRKFFLQWKPFTDNSILRGKHFLHFVKQCLTLVSMVNYHQIQQLLNDQSKVYNKINTDLDQNQIGQIYGQDTDNAVDMVQNTVGLLEWKSKLQRFRQNLSAKKIQKMVRKKFLQPYIEIYNLMFDKVKKVRYLGVPN